MIANHAVPTVVDACLRKLPGVDPERAYAAVKASLTTNHEKSDWDVYNRYGYYPFDLILDESVSRTLEFCFDDWCAAQLAKALGKDEDCAFFESRSRNYRNLFDTSTGFFRGKDSKGNWREPFEPYRYAHSGKQGGDYTEGNAWHYLWHVLQAPEDLIELLGGNEKFVEKLDTLFQVSPPESVTGKVQDITGLIGQYSHGNEPCHHVIYLYTLAGRQDKAAEKIRQVFKEFYRCEPGGLCGNDDCGQMSAWYIFSALGFYPVNPVGGQFVKGEAQVRCLRELTWGAL
jgi:predicted alpha-1,2-mannosidase